MRRQSILKRLIQLALGLVRNERIPKFSSRFSKKTFTQHQLLVLGVLKVKENKNYRDFADWVLFSNEIFYLLKLKRMFHFTTLQKFLQRFDPMVFDQLIAAVFSQIAAVNRSLDVAIDSSGFTSSYCSRYFVMRINRETSYITFMKMSIAVDPKSKALLAVKCRKGPAHDTKDFIPLLRRADRCVSQRIRNVLADRAYDSCKNFHFVEKELHAGAVIPLRVFRRSRAGRSTIRKHRPILPDSRIYGRRNMAETVFSVIKRKFGGDLRSRLTEVKKKEMKLKALVYNLCILTTKKYHFIIGGFLQSLLKAIFI
jgi:transposase